MTWHNIPFPSLLASFGVLLGAVPLLARAGNLPPVVTIELPPNPGWFDSRAGTVVRIKIRVTDPDGDRVSARLDATPSFQGFLPIEEEPSGAERELLWHTAFEYGGRHDLVVRAWDDAQPDRRVLHRETLLLLGANRGRSALFRDVDGDGAEELFSGMALADVNGVKDAGAIAMFDRYGQLGAGPEPALFTAATPSPSGFVGQREGGTLEMIDVTGDGVPELIGRDTKAILVWPHPIKGVAVTTPLATLRSTDPNAAFIGGGNDFLVADVTNDGIDDIVAVASLARVNGVREAGEICIFAGGPTLVGVPAATALLRIPTASVDDRLGAVGSLVPVGSRFHDSDTERQGVVAVDVTGDGVLDIVAGASSADRGSVKDVGRGFVWSGGATLVGIPPPLATLDSAAAQAKDAIGSGGYFFHDVTGDGVRDILVAASTIDPGGAILVWHGGSTLHGVLDATATLLDTSGIGYEVGRSFGVENVMVHDFDGDGVLDVLSVNTLAKIGGLYATGAIYVWRGSNALVGSVGATAMLRRVVPEASDYLGWATGGVQLADVTGDGSLDVVVTTPRARGAAYRSGVVEVWAGGAGFSGTVYPDAVLRVPTSMPNDLLGDDTGSTVAVVIVDVTGDGIRDIAVAACYADVGTLVDAGRAWVWAGGPGLANGATISPIAELSDPAPSNGGVFGWQRDGGFSLHAGDVTGDGVLDLVAVYPSDDWYGLPAKRRGGFSIFEGGAALVGSPAPYATGMERMNRARMGLKTDNFVVADVDGDRRSDVVAHAPQDALERYTYECGAVLLFLGGNAGTLDPIVLQSSLAETSDSGSATYRTESVFLTPRDMSGDGLLDLALLQPAADLLGWHDPGQLLLWRWKQPWTFERSGSPYQTFPPPPIGPGVRMNVEPEIATPADHFGSDCLLGW